MMSVLMTTLALAIGMSSDSHGDHIHTCRQHTGSTKDAHETILDAMQQICHASGLSTQRLDIPTVRKANGKTGHREAYPGLNIWLV